MKTPKKKIWIASDHAGFELKQKLLEALSEYDLVDLGCHSKDSVDYPDYANLVSQSLQNKSWDEGFGLLICGSGQGMAMRANKFPWIRAALVWNHDTSALSREHNNANVLCLGSRWTTEAEALDLVQVFAQTKFAEGRHSPRVAKVGTAL